MKYQFKRINEQKWMNAFQYPDWYLRLEESIRKYVLCSKEGKHSNEEIKLEIYELTRKALENDLIALGKSGQDWDKDRLPIDTVVIHHSNTEPDISRSKLSIMGLLRLYVPVYLSRDEFPEAYGKPIYSDHFYQERQVFYAYHWLVRPYGRSERLLPDNQIGWHAGNWNINSRSIAICLAGDYTDSIPSSEAITEIAWIIRENYKQVTPQKIFGHCEVNPETFCPGEEFISVWKDELIKNVCFYR